ncbi:MAG: PTS transporter subunit EIIA [Lentisphaerae bacterium]|nr:PTS sugar transporter subunit IIA [Lentisphaeria bacterium]NLE68384.1 PTS transporter subunit EIIA [Lentisphaerota bacterium]
MILTLKELAEHLRVNERTILRMLKTGQIQGVKIGGQWRFNGGQIDNVFFPGARHADEEDVPLHDLVQTQIQIPVSRLLTPERILLDLKATTVEGVIEELTPPLLFNNLVLDLNDLREKCLAREKIISTGVGNGLAVPHPRDPITTLRAPGCVIVGRSAKGLDFGAVDKKKVHLFFFQCSQSIELHLHLMGRIATLLRDEACVKTCRNAKAGEEVIAAVMEHERREFLTHGEDDN